MRAENRAEPGRHTFRAAGNLALPTLLVFALSACGSSETASMRVEAATTAGSESVQSAVTAEADGEFYHKSSAVDDTHHDACPHVERGTRGSCCPDQARAELKQARSPEFTWQKPPEWIEVPGNSMRLVSFTLGQADQIECYVTVLPGFAGGVRANMNRWRSQMGLAALTPLEIAELSYIDMLNEKVPLIELQGEFEDADGGRAGAGYGMLGTVCELPAHAVFVKMIGPEAELASEKQRFVKFCSSLARAQ